MGPGSKGQNGVAVVLASMGFGYPIPLVRVPLRPYAAVRERRKMRQYNNVVYLRLNDEQLEHLDRLSHLTGISHNHVLRKLIMDKEIRQRPDVDFLALVTAVDRLGNNINQIAKKANTNNAVSYADMKEVSSIMRKIRSEMNAWKEQWL